MWDTLLLCDLVYVDLATCRPNEQSAAIIRPVERSAPWNTALDWLVWMNVIEHILILEVQDLQESKKTGDTAANSSIQTQTY